MKKLPAHLQGKEYWRSFEQLAESPEFNKYLEAEFPDLLPEMHSPLSRRNFLSIMGASLALAGLAGCRRPIEKIIPYAVQPEEVIPGIAQHYASTMPFGLTSYGVVVECHEGRPTKIEGNKLHPSSFGGSNVFMQAEILNLYDPDRSQNVLKKGAVSSWDDFVAAWRGLMPDLDKNRGEGLALIVEPYSSPTIARLMQDFEKRYPKARVVCYEPVSDENILNGFASAIDRKTPVMPDYHYDRADVILALDSDFLNVEADNVKAAKRYASRRDVADTDPDLNRLYVVEADYSSTGAMADHRMRVQRSHIAAFLLALAAELSSMGLKIDSKDSIPAPPISFDKKWLSVVASDLMAHKGASIIVGGRSLPAEAHELILAINAALGNVGTTVDLYDFESGRIPDRKAMEALITDMAAGNISTLAIVGGNPVYTASGIGFDKALKKVPTSIHINVHNDETSALTSWHIPKAHFLEAWGDTAAFDGTWATIQPMVEPLFGGKSDIEFLNLLASGKDDRGYDIVRATWPSVIKGDFEKNWRRVLHDGIHNGSRRAPIQKASIKAVSDFTALTAKAQGEYEILINPSPVVYDGRYANNGWMQEVPHPVSKLSWDNAAVMNAATARKLGVVNGDVIHLKTGQGEVDLPVWLVPGLADATIVTTVGYGRPKAGRVGTGVGIDIYPLLKGGIADYIANPEISKTGKTYKLSSTQDHGSMAGRPIVREATLDEFKANQHFATEAVEHPPLRGIYPEHDYSKGYQWGMTIDLNRCIGCNACTIACQSENNIPIVGKEQVGNGREMHWIRLDRYYAGDTDNPEVLYQPVACQHCENAPCEEVCPVQATSHDKEGLNVMTYNRCVGTRYCSNNCPYKVRRFNYFNFTKDTPEIVKMAMNPDVTVRSRGVMEKCTFCTQRINRAKITAKEAGRTVVDGEVVTACQQACPADAITFGNINDPNSKVAQMKKRDSNYGLLAEFNTKPRNTYLAKIRNPHPDLKDYSPKNG